MRMTMAPTEKPTFFVYEVGRDPEELCLGNLVLKDYANPTLSRHYTHPRMHPEKFLREQVLSEVEAVQALQMWISGVNRGLGNFKKTPKIWLLTGLYLLKDATSAQEKLRTASQTPTKGLLVWAAQYRALDYHVCKRSAPADIHLLYDVVSEGWCYGGEPHWERGLRLKLSKQVKNAVESELASTCDEADYERLYKNFWICRVSHWLMRDNMVHVPANMTPEQQVKQSEWAWTKKVLQDVRLKVGTTEWERDPSPLEERGQRAYENFMIVEKEYKKSLAEFEGSKAL
ncbi:hypothetical protein V8E51_007708 [Hyaloscypha variabilis]